MKKTDVGYEMGFLKLIFCAAALGCIGFPSMSDTYDLPEGDCPTQLSITLSGVWEEAYHSDDAVAELQANPARTASVAAVFSLESMPMASVSVVFLGALDGSQGSLVEEDLWEIADLFRNQVVNPDPALSARIEERVGELSLGGSLEEFDYSIHNNILIGPRHFVVFGSSQSAFGNIQAAGVFLYEASCILNIQIGFPMEVGLDTIVDSVYSIRVQAADYEPLLSPRP